MHYSHFIWSVICGCLAARGVQGQALAQREPLAPRAACVQIDNKLEQHLTSLQELVEGLTQIDFYARLTLQSPKRRFPGRTHLSWKQSSPQVWQCRITNSFLPRPVLNFNYSAQGAFFSGIGLEEDLHSPLVRNIFNELAKKKPGIPLLPVDELRYWIFGVPSPKLSTTEMIYNGSGQIEKMVQCFLGETWEINFLYPSTSKGVYPLPTRIHLYHPESQTDFRLHVLKCDTDSAFQEKFLKFYSLI